MTLRPLLSPHVFAFLWCCDALKACTYQCERKSTLEYEQKLKRFRTFVNSNAPDNTVVFVEERKQIRPARDEEIVRFVEAESA